MTISQNFLKVQEILILLYCTVFSFFACAYTYHYLYKFLTVTMPGEDGAADPPAKIPTLPFKHPKFDWNASNLYSQFKLFKTKVEFAFKGTYKDNPGDGKVGAILNWAIQHLKFMVVSYGLLLQTKMIL